MWDRLGQMLPFMPGKNKIQFLKDWLRQNTGINLDTLTINIAPKVMSVGWVNDNETDSEEELGVSWEEEYQVKSIDVDLVNIVSQEKLK